MKTRTTAFTLALCLISSFVLADNPSDAALAADDAGSAVVQQDQNTASKDRQGSKEEKALAKKMAKQSSTPAAKKAAKNPERPAKANTTSAL